MLYKGRPTIGLFAEFLPVGYFYPVFKGIYETCVQKKVNFRVFLGANLDSPNNYNKYKNIIYTYADKKSVDGIITTSASMSIYVTKERFQSFLSSIPVPKISIGMEIEETPSIIINNRESLYKTVCHLIEVHGYKKIAYIGGPENNEEAAARFEGYKKALSDYNILYDPRLYIEGQFQIDSGVNACKTLFEKRKLHPRAIVCANDDMAMGVYHYCKARNIKIPEDIAVTGFDNLIISQSLDPQLTTVAQPLFGQGATAVLTLLNIIEGRQVKNTIHQPTHLLTRGSCGCRTIDEVVKDTPPGISINTEQKREIRTFLEKMNDTISASPITEHPEKLFSILENIVKMMTSKANDFTLSEKIKTILMDKNVKEMEIRTWLDFINLFYGEVRNILSSGEIIQRIDYIFFLIHYIIHTTLRAKASNIRVLVRMNTHLNRNTLNNISSCLSLKTLFTTLKIELTLQGFNYFYMSFYDGDKLGYLPGELNGRKMRLFIGYNEKKVINGMEEKICFEPEELIPSRFFSPHKPHHFMAYPLVMGKYHFGTFIIDYQEDKFDYYDPIYVQLRTSLNLIRLFDKNERKQQELNEINTNLEQKVKERTSKLTDANEKLLELDRAKTAFFANISHELRTPLTLLLGPLESFHAGDYGPSMHFDDPVVTSMVANGSRLLKLINNLLDFSKLDAGKLKIQKSPTPVAELLGYFMSIIKTSAETKGIITEYKSTLGNISASIDRELFEKAFFNLISNALKFTPRGGKITVILSKGQNNNQEHTLNIEVHDTGCGIETDKIETIFDRFTRLDETENRKYEGTGIGLAYTKEIIQLHGGTITASSEYGKGSVFTLSIPLEKEQHELPAGEIKLQDVKQYLLHDLSAYGSWADIDSKNSSGPVEDTTKKKTICVVDDNQDMRGYLTSILENDYRIVTSENGKKGLIQIKNLMPDLVISDVMMPVMNGLELCRIIKENPDLGHIPVLLLTARMDASGKLEGLKGKADDYLFKPFNARELLTRLENLLANRELQIELSGKQLLIMNSIKYASRIQKALLPSPSALKQQMASFFTLWKPRDIVGGDIYWFKDYGDSFLIALADCTGHGIPGALMTMITHSLLNRITDHICRDNPGRILSELNKLIKTALDQVDEKKSLEDLLADDGLDMGLCWINKKEHTCIYAGARRPLYFFKNGELEQLEGDKKSIGYRQIPYETSYSNRHISFNKQTVFYLTTDGYADQIGGSRTFGTRRLKKLLTELRNKSFDIQQKELEDALARHMDDNSQIDDYTIIGFSPALE